MSTTTGKQGIIHAYLFFEGTCEEAVKFYAKTIGAKVDMTMRYRESPDSPPPGTVPENWGEKIMHTSFHVGETMVMASDGCGDEVKFGGFRLSLALPTKKEAEKAFAALAAGGKVDMPLMATFWSPCFGMLTDKFGVGWMVTVLPDMPPADSAPPAAKKKAAAPAKKKAPAKKPK